VRDAVIVRAHRAQQKSTGAAQRGLVRSVGAPGNGGRVAGAVLGTNHALRNHGDLAAE
jgi:hypothetical protein